MFCIFCGSPVAGTVTLACDACGRTHYLGSKLSGSTLTVVGDEYLVVQRAFEPEAGKWDLPGGFCEYGEDPADAARRETFEETGLQVAVDRLLGAWMDEYTEAGLPPWPTVNLIYAAHLEEPGAVAHTAADEVTAVAWFALDGSREDLAFPHQQLGAIAAFQQHRS